MAFVSAHRFLRRLPLHVDVVLLTSLVSYAKLVVLSIGLRDGMRQGMRHNNPFADQCVNAASEILTQVVDKLAKVGCEFCFSLFL